MGMTELDEIQALLDRVLPDPSGFAQRLMVQAMARWGQSASSGASPFYRGANGVYTAGAPERTKAGKTVVSPDEVIVDEAPVDINLLLAAALGACECWGLRQQCPMCSGQGSSGWIQPDAELFTEFVQPAVARSPHIFAADREHDGHVSVSHNSDHHHTVEGKGNE
jgi:hypothetical protein